MERSKGPIYLDTEIEFNPALPPDLQSDMALQDRIAVVRKEPQFLLLGNNPETLPIFHQSTSC